MDYSEKIRKIAEKVPSTLVDFSQPRGAVRIPTQASSNFITNKEQGDWAERLVLESINKNSKKHCAVKYGKSDDRVAGETGFDEFYQEFQEELDTIGKRPDILIFKKVDFDPSLGLDISQQPHGKIYDYVRKAVAGIEIRSSAFLIDKYDAVMREKVSSSIERAIQIKEKILNDYADLLSSPNRNSYVSVLKGMLPENLCVADFRVPSWRGSSKLVEVSDLFKKLKAEIKEVQKRDFLSITPKVEDIKVVYKWVETFNVPHYYFQVFFDKVYGLSFESILSIVSDPDNEGSIFSVESDSKNQNKTTIKINSKSGTMVAYKVDEPSHRSIKKEMDRGRLLFYVTFEGGVAYLDVSGIEKLLGIEEGGF